MEGDGKEGGTGAELEDTGGAERWVGEGEERG